MSDHSASVFCFTPLRVPVSELGRLATGPPMPSASSPASSPPPVCSAPPLPQGPCPVCPRLEQEFEPWRQAAYWKAMHRRALEREAQLQAEIQRLEALVRLREQQLFGARPRPPRRRLQRPRTRPTPTHRHDSRVASNAVGPVRSAAIIPTSLTLSKKRSCRPTSAAARSVVSLSPISRAPRIPPSWRSMSGPIAESFAVAVIDRLARVVLIPASSPPRHRPG